MALDLASGSREPADRGRRWATSGTVARDCGIISSVPGRREIGPRLTVKEVSRRVVGSGRWHVAWEIRNLGKAPLRLVTARLPHGRFRSRERALRPAPTLSPGEQARVEASVACGGLPGTVVENAFLILRVRWRDEPWQVFARFRVVFDDDGAPATVTERLSAQRVGFSAPRTRSI